MKYSKPPVTNSIISHAPDVVLLFERKTHFFQGVIQKTLLHVQKNKMLDIINTNELNKCVNILYDLSKTLKEIITTKDSIPTEQLLGRLQDINNDLSGILKLYGTESMEDLLTICIGANGILGYNENKKYELLKQYFHPTGYMLIANGKPEPQTLVCHEISQSSKTFHVKVYGAKVVIYDTFSKKTLGIPGILDDILVDCLNNDYISTIKHNLIHDMPPDDCFHTECFANYTQSLMLKDYILYDTQELFAKYTGSLGQLTALKQKDMSTLVKEFLDNDLFSKRHVLVQLLIHSDVYDNQYLAYLLYDTLSNDNNGVIDTQEQTILFDSFPWHIKQCFRDAMKNTIQYTTELTHFDVNKIPLEQQICLMNTSDIVKEKAMTKLKEVKAKSDDSGSKARQYLDGLLKIPFGIYKKENILTIMNDIKQDFTTMFSKNDKSESKKNYTSIEIINHMNSHKNIVVERTKPDLIAKAKEINAYIKENGLPSEAKIEYTNKKKEELRELIENFTAAYGCLSLTPYGSIQKKFEHIKDYMKGVNVTLDKSVHGHEKAKKQIARIIGQWINGEQDGHCFGFEGPPGVGKTSLAKYGLANCLTDGDGNSRPFAMIQMGGDCQGSTLVGHNYTYVGSTWGSIVQILMDKKCMNPIIFIDELDKVSKTENGKEIIGILTHMLDPTQNDCFQDKYFTGVDINLSKALFILSYNDADSIDKILLDRVHRVKFAGLTLEEKVVITHKHILPDVYKKMGLEGMIVFSDEIIKYIVEEYTCESGVRKLKEIFFEIVGEINLEVLTSISCAVYPIHIKKEDILKYFKDKREMIYKPVNSVSKIATINGMYATSVGSGGLLPITAMFFPSDKFLDLKLTGLQQEVMRESMHLALTLAWNLTSKERQIELRTLYETSNKCGINIHAGDLDVQKEGPSAGIAISCVLYSLLNNLLIKPYFAVTGEILMNGDVSAIGGLAHKITGSLKSKATSFIFPKENEKDYNELIEKYKDTELIKGIQFYPVSNIQEVFELIFDKES
jgi:ATP-dependent Lon protease